MTRDLVVISPLKDFTCASCGGTGAFLVMEDGGPLCLTCADLGQVTGAVVASVRHENTRYDELLMSGAVRAEARERVRPDIDRILDVWRRGSSG